MEDKNKPKKHDVPIFTYEEYIKMMEEGKKIKGCYKIAEEDSEKFLNMIKNR